MTLHWNETRIQGEEFTLKLNSDFVSFIVCPVNSLPGTYWCDELNTFSDTLWGSFDLLYSGWLSFETCLHAKKCISLKVHLKMQAHESNEHSLFSSSFHLINWTLPERSPSCKNSRFFVCVCVCVCICGEVCIYLM